MGGAKTSSKQWGTRCLLARVPPVGGGSGAMHPLQRTRSRCVCRDDGGWRRRVCVCVCAGSLLERGTQSEWQPFGRRPSVSKHGRKVRRYFVEQARVAPSMAPPGGRVDLNCCFPRLFQQQRQRNIFLATFPLLKSGHLQRSRAKRQYRVALVAVSLSHPRSMLTERVEGERVRMCCSRFSHPTIDHKRSRGESTDHTFRQGRGGRNTGCVLASEDKRRKITQTSQSPTKGAFENGVLLRALQVPQNHQRNKSNTNEDSGATASGYHHSARYLYHKDIYNEDSLVLVMRFLLSFF